MKKGENALKKWILLLYASCVIRNTITELIASGVLHHLILRKLYIEKIARDFLASNPEGQIVNVGAGLDTLLSRLAGEFSNNDFIEIDYPVVAELKQQVCRFDNLIFSGADLSERPIKQVLTETSFSEKNRLFF